MVFVCLFGGLGFLCFSVFVVFCCCCLGFGVVVVFVVVVVVVLGGRGEGGCLPACLLAFHSDR